MSDDDKANDEPAARSDDADAVKLLKQIRDFQAEALDRQTRFLWILVPIFAVLCVQTALLLTH